MNVLPHINEEWTLFLDRDGVINAEKKEEYGIQEEIFK